MFWNYAVNLVENTHATVWFKSHFAMGVLLWICCIFSEHLFVRTPLEGSFFILQVNWKKRLQYRCFLMSFNSFLQTPFLQNTSRKQLLFYGKHFANKIEKNPEWMETDCKKNNDTQNHYLHQVFILFYYSFYYFFIFSQLPMMYWKHEFLETIQSHWRSMYHRKLFLTFG